MKLGDTVCLSKIGIDYLKHDHICLEKFTPLDTFEVVDICKDTSGDFVALNYIFGDKYGASTRFFRDELLIVKDI